jgi:LysM repeat protein
VKSVKNGWLPALVVGLVLSGGGVAVAQEVYVVRSGDSLSKIANRFGITVADLKAANGLAPGRRGDLIMIGQQLTIPAQDSSTDTGLPTPTRSYTVVAGDSLSRIAGRFGTTAAWLRQKNRISGDLIVPGQVLVVPGVPAASAPSATTVTGSSMRGRSRGTDTSTQPRRYQVIRGDSLSGIAIKFNTTVSWLKNRNGLASDIIHPGDTLVVPGAAGANDPNPRAFPMGYTEQPAMTASAAHLEVLARIVKGECSALVPWEGKVAVAAVVLNRVRSSRFPNTIPGVAHQRKQFSCYNPGERNRLYWGPIPDYAWAAARAALRGEDPTHGCTYYFNPFLVRPSWARRISTGETSLESPMSSGHKSSLMARS